jgi:Outer membrane cobalamin receptor protein
MKEKNAFRRPAAVFSRWSNKGWAVFDSLKKVVKIGRLSAVYTLLALPMCSFAQTDTVAVNKNVDMDEVVVNAVGKKNVYSELSRIVITIKKDDIDKQAIHSVQDLLEQVLGADVRARGVLGVQADVSLRGGTFDQVLILLNGVNIADPQTGHHNLDIPLNIESVDRIEILQGPGTRIYGPNAFSGAINIITGERDGTGATVGANAGQYGYFSGYVSSRWEKKNFKNFISIAHSRSGGYVDNTDFNTRSIFYQGQLSSLLGKSIIQAGFSDKGFGANSFYTPLYPNQYERTKACFAAFTHSSTFGKFEIDPQVYWRRHHDRFELFRNNPPAWYINHNYHLTDVVGGKIMGSFRTFISRTSLGAELRYEHIYSNVLGTLMADTLSDHCDPAGFFTRHKGRRNANFNIEQTLYLRSLIVSGGIMALWNSDFGWDKTLGIDASYLVSHNYRLYSSINQSLRLPTFTDLYYSGPQNQGNPGLRPEHALSYELGVKANYSKLAFQLSVVRREGRDIIDWIKDSTDIKYTTRNLTKVNTNGFETAVTYLLGDYFGQKPNSTKVVVSYSFYKNEKNSSGLISAYSLDYLRQKFVASVTSTLYREVGFAFTISYRDRAGNYTDASSNEINYTPFTICDLGIFYVVGSWNFFGEASNIFNRSYVDIGSVVQPGRWFKAGFRFDI